MRALHCMSILCLVSCVFGQQAPWGRGDIPVSARDRVYAADQTSNTVSVIDPSSNKLLGVIRLGDPVPGALSPLYRGELLVHGLGYSPDSKTLAVVSVASNSVTLIDTATNAIKEKPTERGPFRRLVLSRRWCMQSPHRPRRRPGDS